MPQQDPINVHSVGGVNGERRDNAWSSDGALPQRTLYCPGKRAITVMYPSRSRHVLQSSQSPRVTLTQVLTAMTVDADGIVKAELTPAPKNMATSGTIVAATAKEPLPGLTPGPKKTSGPVVAAIATPPPKNMTTNRTLLAATAREPLFGFIPRRVKGEQVRMAMVQYLGCRSFWRVS